MTNPLQVSAFLSNVSLHTKYVVGSFSSQCHNAFTNVMQIKLPHNIISIIAFKRTVSIHTLHFTHSQEKVCCTLSSTKHTNKQG